MEVDPDDLQAANEKVEELQENANANSIELAEAKVEQANLELEEAQENAEHEDSDDE